MKSKYRWIIAERKTKDLKLQLLYNRRIIKNFKKTKANLEKIDAFLNPNPKKHLFDPFKLSEIKKALQRILKAKKNKEKIGIFADYDADGVPGGVLIYEALEKIGFSPSVYIPSRCEGYGFSKEALNFFEKEKVSLIIVVDAGTRDFEAIEEANKKNIDVLVFDHHEPGDRLPKAYAIVNPKKKGEKYPFRELSGAGVAFKLVQALSKYFKIDKEFLKWSLDLVAISVIFDMVPLLSENRVFAKYGLLILENTRRIGLKELIKISGLKERKMDAFVVGFILGPRINAPSRMYKGRIAFDLLITKDSKKARKLAEILDKINYERQRETERCILEAKEMVKKRKLFKKKVILVGSEEWPEGLIGLIASKLKDEFGRPVFVFSRGNKKSKGSARSIDGFHLVEILGELDDLILKGGGHSKAAGIELENEKFELFYNRLLELADDKIKNKDLGPTLNIDGEIDFSEISFNLVNIIKKFSPFGIGNPEPLFLSRNVEVLKVRKVGNNSSHLSFILGKNGNIFKGIYFNGGEHFEKIKIHDFLDIVYALRIDEYLGEPRIELKIEDLRTAKSH